MVHPAASKATPALNRSMLNVLNAAYLNRTAANRLWNVAPSCPLFLKKSTRKSKTGVKKRVYRANRVLKGHTIKALASGAAANAATLAQSEALQLRNDVVPESYKYPLLPCVSKSAAALIEAALVAYLQEGFGNSVALKKAMGKHKKVTSRCAQMGIDALNERIATATAFVPSTVVPKLSATGKTTASKKKQTKTKSAEATEEEAQGDSAAAAAEAEA